MLLFGSEDAPLCNIETIKLHVIGSSNDHLCSFLFRGFVVEIDYDLVEKTADFGSSIAQIDSLSDHRDVEKLVMGADWPSVDGLVHGNVTVYVDGKGASTQVTVCSFYLQELLLKVKKDERGIRCLPLELHDEFRLVS